MLQEEKKCIRGKLCGVCGMTYSVDDRKKIENLQSKLYYIENKTEHNKKRKTYKRQAWADRKDNPENKELSKTEICFKNFFRSIIDG